ncbi:MAG: ParA family protein [Leptolyngbya sp. SIO1E4]|nr:ParA family protein [Leptolyngbya sp. SIO1E4]
MISELEKALKSLPPAADEAIVEQNFSKQFLKALGYGEQEIRPQFPVGKRWVDQAARKNTEDDIFLHTGNRPYLYMEVKGRTANLAEGHPDYRKAALQLKQYLLNPASKSVRWGILTNSVVAQLFCKHGKVVHPVTPCLSFEDVKQLVKDIKKRIEAPQKSLIVTVYNNKGGVGKTTTTLNLAATLSMLKRRVLVIDFDPNQSDLGDALNLSPSRGEMRRILEGKSTDIREVIKAYRFEHPKLKEPLGFDVILADEELVSDIDEVKLRQKVKPAALLRALELIKTEYDYILIDAPPNWRIFSQRAIYAADVVLIPARHDNLHSLQNAAMAITKFIPEAQRERNKAGDAGPIALPVFMNNAFRVSEAQLQLMQNAIARIIKDAKKDGFDLTSYFYPRLRRGHRDLRMISIPYMAYISKSDFLHVPAAFAFKNARDQYLNLAKEYFIQ